MDEPELVAELNVQMKNGNQIFLYHSWNDIVITERGIEFIPNSPDWEFSWETVDSITIVNTNSPNHWKNKKR